MSKYINADIFIIPKGTVDDIAERGVPAIHDLLDIQPSADVVEVIRCKDCMYFKSGWCMKEDIRYGYVCGDDATTFEPDEDFWCKYGERKKTE